MRSHGTALNHRPQPIARARLGAIGRACATIPGRPGRAAAGRRLACQIWGSATQAGPSPRNRSGRPDTRLDGKSQPRGTGRKEGGERPAFQEELETKRPVDRERERQRRAGERPRRSRPSRAGSEPVGAPRADRAGFAEVGGSHDRPGRAPSPRGPRPSPSCGAAREFCVVDGSTAACFSGTIRDPVSRPRGRAIARPRSPP
jgi:hypothetical protein